MSEQLGRTIRRDPLQGVKQQHERDLQQALLGVWRDYLDQFIEYLSKRPQVKRAAEGLIEDVLQAALWAQLSKALLGVLLPAIEAMMHEAVTHALDDLPISDTIDLDPIHAEVADWAREHALELSEQIDETTKRRVRSEMANWVATGESPAELEARMRKIFEAPWRARMIAVTEVTRAFAYATERAWQSSRVIVGKRWQTANDPKVCPICEPLHGVVRGLGKSFPGGYRNPGDTHPNCRCWITPVVDMETPPAFAFGQGHNG